MDARSNEADASVLAIAFREAQRLRQHVSHRIDVGEHALAQFAIANELGLKAVPREWRAEIVCDRGEHTSTLSRETLEPRLHGLERRHGRELAAIESPILRLGAASGSFARSDLLKP